MSGPVSRQLRRILQSLQSCSLTDSEAARMRIDGEAQDETVYLQFVNATRVHMEAFKSLAAARSSKSAVTSVGGCIFTFLITR